MKTLFIGHNLIELDSIESTNSYANELLNKEMFLEGSIVWAKNQTNGRGQRGNTWESEPSANLTLSVVLYPSFLFVDRQFYLTKTISLAVADFVSDIVEENGQKAKVSIKWPNDIYVGDKKIAGILIENSIRGNTIANSIVGIGLNINQKVFNRHIINPVSLSLICKHEFDIKECIVRLSSYIEARYLQLKSGNLMKLDEEYRSKLYRHLEWATFKIEDNIIQAKIIDTSSEGKIILETTDHKKKEYDLKEIYFVL